jgi:protoheme IX farnesyltransferase
MYRRDYERAGFPMLTVIDAEGRSAAFQILMYVLPLVPLSLLPTLLHVTGLLYFVGAAVLGIGFAAAGIRTASRRTNASAKQLLLASIIYLPVLLLLMVVDKV